MIVGCGVIYSEMFEQCEGCMVGFQFWLNLLVKDKMCELWYFDVQGFDVFEYECDGVMVCVIVGESYGVKGVVQCVVIELFYLDLYFVFGVCFEQVLLVDYNVFVYVYEGVLKFDSGCLQFVGCMVILVNMLGSDGVWLQMVSDGQVLICVILVVGKLLGELIVQYGFFVMNIEVELVQVVCDFQVGCLV